MRVTTSRPFGAVGVRGAIAMLMVLFVAVGSIAFPASRALADNANAPVATDPFEGAASVDLSDGLYQVDVVMEGGSGRASVKSPAELEVANGRAVVKLIWSSKNYDYMVIGGKKYLPVSKTGNSTFVVPVIAYDTPIPTIGDTTAMSEAHEVDYQLTVSRESIKPMEGSSSSASVSSGSAGASEGAAASAAASESAATSASTSESVAASTATSASAASSATAMESGKGTTAQTSNTEAAQAQGGLTWPWIVFIVCVIASAICIGITIGILRGYRNR